MTRSSARGEWMSGAQAARWLGLTAQAIGVWGTRPGAPIRMTDGKREYQWPAFPRWREDQLVAERVRPLNDLDLARQRKIQAEATRAEHELSRIRGDLVSVASFRETMSAIAQRIRLQLLAAPGRYSPRIVGCASLPQAQRVLDEIVRDIIAELREG